MSFDPKLPFQLNDGTPVELIEAIPHKLRIGVPSNHPLGDPDFGNIRDFALDGTRNNIGASPPYDFYLVNTATPVLTTELEVSFTSPNGASLTLHPDFIPDFPEYISDADIADVIIEKFGFGSVAITRKTTVTTGA